MADRGNTPSGVADSREEWTQSGLSGLHTGSLDGDAAAKLSKEGWSRHRRKVWMKHSDLWNRLPHGSKGWFYCLVPLYC
jgi:hypothetical protein